MASKEREDDDIEFLPLNFEKKPDFLNDEMEEIEEWISKMPDEIQDKLREGIVEIREKGEEED